VDGSVEKPAVKAALAVARRTCVQLTLVGSYPTRQAYTS